jgi:cobalt-zinc-cadmium resistance protein CzcA
LPAVPGVTDVLSIGGHILQYQIRVNPYALRKYDLTLGDVIEAVRANNRNVGGQFLPVGSEEHLVRGIGLLEDLEGIRNVPVKVVNGTAVRVGDVGEVTYGQAIRRGAASLDGRREVVSGLVLKLYGENTSEVIDRLYRKVAEVRASLPAGVELVAYYEQADLVSRATWTVLKALLVGATLVMLTLALMLGNFRTALIVATALPISALAAVVCMGRYHVSANLMSLGGIAIGIGMLGDGAIVMVENIHRRLGKAAGGGADKLAVIRAAGGEVARPIVFSIAIIVLVFTPIFALEGVEGKMFRPLAFTISVALLGSMAAALFVAPALSAYLLRPGARREFQLLTWLKAGYRFALRGAIRFRRVVLAAAVTAFVVALAMLAVVGTEFVPTLEEGSILIGVTMAPSISLEKAAQTVARLEREIVRRPEVEEVFSRIGRPEAGSHPHPVNYAEVHVELKPRNLWPPGRGKGDLVAALNRRLSRHPGVQLNFSQPIQNAFDELLSGTKAQLAIKIFGDDLEVLRELARRAGAAIEDVEGLVDLSVEQSFGQDQVRIVVDREACSRHGVAAADIMEIVELAVGGEVIDSLYLHTRRFGIHVRLQEAYRSDPEAIGDIRVPTDGGARIPLSEVAHIRRMTGPAQISREANQRRWMIQGNVRGRDLGGVFRDVRRRIAEQVKLPPGYFVEYGGQFENQRRASRRLAIIVPVVIAGILGMLWMAFGSARLALIIILNVPLALIGGVFGLLVTGEYLSVPASVGFIALFGIAVQNGLVLVGTIRQLRLGGMELSEALTTAGTLRLRPVLLTAVTTILGLMPLLLSRGIGSEVQRPLAVVVVFGLTTSTLLTLFVIPAVYGWFEGKGRTR